jgi:hypothetical protein
METEDLMHMQLPKSLTDWADRGADDAAGHVPAGADAVAGHVRQLLHNALELGIMHGALHGAPDEVYDEARAHGSDVVLHVAPDGETRIIKSRVGVGGAAPCEKRGSRYVYLMELPIGESKRSG